jgi:uncharacterized protein YcfJ
VKRFIGVLLLVIMVSGCETSLNETQTGALGGSALGAGLGAIIGNQTGHAGAGTAIGAGAGLLAGSLIGEGMRRSKQAQTTQAAPYQQQVTPVVQQQSGQVRQVHTRFCPTCGTTYPEDVKYCPKDGTELKYIE